MAVLLTKFSDSYKMDQLFQKWFKALISLRTLPQYSHVLATKMNADFDFGSDSDEEFRLMND